ncbi:serine hydrolase domain-containing protein [Rhodococcus olei]|uniref:Serine hydrolase domain-containing protein n=1 Tax=Rhodococcus olei TaxID=2161675 RepID=A0ABP8NXG2_9NOCA
MVFKIDVPPEMVHGEADEGYGPVADQFRRNFAERGEVGAACVIYRDGVKVVDLWGGYRDGHTRAPWLADTMVLLFSTTKGIASLACAVAHSRGLLDYDAKVATYWPEFAQQRKQDVTVRQLLSHQAGLCAIDRHLSVEELADLDLVAAAIAAQRPAWTPSTQHGYHALSLGWYEGELIRRVDPAHRTLGRFFAEEIAAPLDLDFHIGLPQSVDRERIARLYGYTQREMFLHLHQMPWRFVLAVTKPRSISARAFANPKATIENYNRLDLQTIELPAVNGIGRVDSVAKAYSAVAVGGTALHLGRDTLDALSQPAIPPRNGLRDVVLRVDTTFSLGYMKPFPDFRFGSSAGLAFGTPGLGGSFGFADPDTGIGFGYGMNRCGFHLWDDPREVSLRNALYVDVLGEMPQRRDSSHR